MKQYLKPIVAITTIVTIIINVFANILPYNNLTTAQVSDSFKVFFVPAGYVFSIWGVIYLGMTAYSFYQLRTNNEALNKAATYIIIGNVANSVWIFTWHYLLIPFTLPLMLILLVSLIQTYLILKQSKGLNSLFTTIPFGIYLGWISVATIANTTDLLDYIGVKSLVFTGEVWAALLLIIAGVFGTIFLRRYKEISYTLVIIWAIVGIAVKFSTVDIINYTAFLVALVLSAQVLIHLLSKFGLSFTLKK